MTTMRKWLLWGAIAGLVLISGLAIAFMPESAQPASTATATQANSSSALMKACQGAVIKKLGRNYGTKTTVFRDANPEPKIDLTKQPGYGSIDGVVEVAPRGEQVSRPANYHCFGQLVDGAWKIDEISGSSVEFQK